MKLTSENTTRKIDSLGRVSIPKGMRDRLELEEGQEMEFYLLDDGCGKHYVCLHQVGEGEGIDTRYEVAIQVLTELGLEIPRELRRD